MKQYLTLTVVICYLRVLHGSEVCLQRESGSIRLAGLNSSYVGYVQVCKTGYWTSIAYEAEEHWSKKNAIVACRELGFQGTTGISNKDGLSPTAVQRSGSSSEPLSSLQYYSVECTGLERRLVDCTWTIRTVKSSKRDAIALCKKDPYDGEVMVVGINGADKEGIVALYNPLKTYRWSTLCTTDWDDTDADVACRQLGYSGGTSKSYGSEQELLSKNLPRKRYSFFGCSGSELKLKDCPHHGPYPYQCSGERYAGIKCNQDDEDNSVLNLNIALLGFMILISLLLIIILMFLLRCTLKRLRKKPQTHCNTDTASQQGRESRVNSPQLNIVRTQLDLEMPYLSTTVAPPSYQDTLLADQIVQQDSAPAYSLEEEPVTDREGGEEAEDVGSNLSMHQLLLPEQEAEMRTCDRGMNTSVPDT